jgi:hypothetical protein
MFLSSSRGAAAVAALILLAASLAVTAAPSEWISVFDGKSLNGWMSTGKAVWTVENGQLVGRQGEGGAPGDIFTVKTWANFELEAEWKMRFPGNSGIWFRVAKPNTGYQADILDQGSHPGVLSGSLYCMGKAFIAENRDPSSVKKDDWNSIRIRAVGDEITIVQNGKTIIQVRDSTFRNAGSIGAQVHQGKEFEGMEIRLRNIRLRPLK